MYLAEHRGDFGLHAPKRVVLQRLAQRLYGLQAGQFAQGLGGIDAAYEVGVVLKLGQEHIFGQF